MENKLIAVELVGLVDGFSVVRVETGLVCFAPFGTPVYDAPADTWVVAGWAREREADLAMATAEIARRAEKARREKTCDCCDAPFKFSRKDRAGRRHKACAAHRVYLAGWVQDANHEIYCDSRAAAKFEREYA